jgi:hypothetical protein
LDEYGQLAVITDMPTEHLVAIAGTAFIFLGAALMARSVLRGRAACRDFARLLPEDYAAHDSPLAGFFLNPRNTAYAIFLQRRSFEQLPERRLVLRFREIQQQDARVMTFIFAGFGALGIAWLWIEVFSGGG